MLEFSLERVDCNHFDSAGMPTNCQSEFDVGLVSTKTIKFSFEAKCAYKICFISEGMSCVYEESESDPHNNINRVNACLFSCFHHTGLFPFFSLSNI